MLLILKIPVVYLGCVVYWAIKAEPRPGEGAARLATIEPDPPAPWHRRLRRPYLPLRPHGTPRRAYARAPARARARAEAEQRR
jgi:hypothetical protein